MSIEYIALDLTAEQTEALSPISKQMESMERESCLVLANPRGENADPSSLNRMYVTLIPKPWADLIVEVMEHYNKVIEATEGSK